MNLGEELQKLLSQPQAILPGRSLGFAKARQGITVRTAEGDKQAIAATDINTNDVTVLISQNGRMWAFSPGAAQQSGLPQLTEFSRKLPTSKPKSLIVPSQSGGDVFLVVMVRKIRPSTEEFQLWIVDRTGTILIRSTGPEPIDRQADPPQPGGEFWNSVLHYTPVPGNRAFVCQILLFNDAEFGALKRRSLLIENGIVTGDIVIEDPPGSDFDPISYPAPFAQYSQYLMPTQQSLSFPLYSNAGLSRTDHRRAPTDLGQIVMIQNRISDRQPVISAAIATYADYLLNNTPYSITFHQSINTATGFFEYPATESSPIRLDYEALGHRPGTPIEISGSPATFASAASQPLILTQRTITIPQGGGDNNEDRILMLARRHYLPMPVDFPIIPG